MNKIEKIKEWVKKQKKETLARNSIGVITGQAIFVDANDLLSFLDTLSEEPDKGLEEAAEKYRRESYSKSILPNIDGPMSEYGGNVKAAFIAGAEWQKSKMLKDAVEGEVYLYHSYNRDATAIFVDIPKENLGDKVRLIVLKEEEE